MGTPFSYSTRTKNRENNAFLLYNIDSPAAYRHNGQGSATRGFADGKWHHVCMTWKKGQGMVYLDGTLGKKFRGSGSRYKQNMWAQGVFVLGQEQDCDGGCFDKNQAYEGRLTRVNVYDKFMTQEECKTAGDVGQVGTVASWKDII